MPTTFDIIMIVLPVFAVMGTGIILRRLDWLQPKADQSLMRVVINLFYPALILIFTMDNAALRQPANLVLPPLAGLVTVGLGYGLAWMAAAWFGIGRGMTRRTFTFTTGLFNYGYLPIPLVAAIYPEQDTVGVLMVFNLGVEIAFWTIGVLLLRGGMDEGWWQRILTAPVLGLFAGVLFNLLGLGPLLPDFLLKTIQFLGQCAIPMGLLLAGASLADSLTDFSWRGAFRVAASSIVLRLGVLPALFLLMACFLPFSIEIRRVLAVQAAMPAAMFTLVVNKYHNGDTQTATVVVLGTTICSLATIPLWLSFGLTLPPLLH